MLARAALALLLFPIAASAAEVPAWDVPFAASAAQLREAAGQIRIPPNADVDVLLDEVALSWDAQGRETRVSRLVYRVHTPKGVQEWGATSAGWAPWHDNRPSVRVRVIDPSGREFRLDPSTLSEGPAQPEAMTYSDGRVLRGPFPGLVPGSVVEEEVTWSEHAPFFDAGLAGRLILDRGTRAELTRVRFEAPVSLPLHWEVRAKGVEVKSSERDGRRRVELTRGPWQRDGAPVEPSAPDDVLPYAHLEFATGASWQAVAARYHQRVEERIGNVDRKAMAQSITRGAKDRTEAARRVLAWVQDHVRYTGLQLGEASIIPASPEETLDRGFGDCKDLSTVTVALLRAAGVPANVALLRTAGGEITEGLPGLGLVDHAIVQVPAGKGQPELWMDPTVPTLPAGELPAWLQGRPVLVAHPSTRKLNRLPQSSPSDNVAVTAREWRLSEWGPAQVRETRTLTGALAEQYRSTARSGREQLEQTLREFATQFYRADGIEKLEYTPVPEMGRPFEIRLEVPQAASVGTGWSDVSVQLPPSLAFSWIPGELKPGSEDEGQGAPATRTSEFVLPFPHQAEMRHRLVPPPGFAVQLPLPGDETLKIGPAKYEIHYTLEKDGAVLARFRVDSVKRRYSASEVEAFRKAYTAMIERGMPELRFQHEAVQRLEEGQIREALALYRQRIADAPKSAIAHVRYAGALIDLGLGDAAREEAKRATLIGSDELITWLTLGWVRSRDLFGREFAPGYDRAGAIEALKKAVALAPNDGEIRMRLARVYERNAEGELYGQGANLAQAIAAYTHAVDTLKTTDAEVPLTGALFAAGRYDDLIARAPKLSESPQRNLFWIAAVALKNGEAAAIAQAQRSIRDVNARREAIVSASQQLAGLSRYQVAAALLREGTRGSADSRRLEYLPMLEKVRPLEEVKIPADDPRAAIVALVRPMLDQKLNVVDAFAARIREEAPSDSAEISALMAAPLRSMPHEVRRFGVDAIASAVQMATEGDAKSGYRVRMTSPFAPDSMSYFVVVEKGIARVLGTSDNPGIIAGEAFIAAQRDDLASARRWMEWTRELVPSREDPIVREFLRVWPRGHQGSKDEILYASALLASQEFDADQVIPYLVEQEKKAPPERRAVLWAALARAHLEEKQFDAALPWADKLLAEQPDSSSAFMLKIRALDGRNDCEGQSAAAQARLKLAPFDGLAVAVLSGCAVKQGDVEGAIAVLRSQVEAQRAGSSDYNNLAWFSLVAGRVDPTVVDWAVRAVSLEQERGGASLNTLACIYARAGKGREAMRFLLKSMETGQEDMSATWYAAGLIAEDFGLVDEAKRLFSRVEKPKARDAGPDSSWVLAQARLAELQKAVSRADPE